MKDSIEIENIAIVLHKPKLSENIGAVLRAARNMGFTRVIVNEPVEFDIKRVKMMATSGAAELADRIIFFSDLEKALSPYHYVIGTTARIRRQFPIHTPRDIVSKLSRISKNNQIAILFGPEDSGLSNDDIRFCHELIQIPTADFSSLNLAQAVMIVCYEIFVFGRNSDAIFAPRLASRHELDGMYDQVKDILIRISYINPENPEYWMNNLRKYFTRLQLTAKEVSMIRGICRQINWYAHKNYEDGLRNGREHS